MSIITLPVAMPIQTQTFGIRRFEQSYINPDNGSSQTKVMGPARLTCALTSEEVIPIAAQAAMWRSILFALKGRVNQAAIFDYLRQVPRGTARGVWTAANAAPAGGDTLIINAGVSQAGKTLLQGDWIGVNQASGGRQLLHVQQDAVVDSSGWIGVVIAENLRIPVALGSSIVWERPTCLMRQTVDQVSWKTEGKQQGGFSLDLMESWS